MAKVIEKIRNKINSNPSLYIFIIFSEITYLAVFFGILLGFGCIRPMGDLLIGIRSGPQLSQG